MCWGKSGCRSRSSGKMVSRVCVPVVAGIMPVCRTSFSLPIPCALWSHCTPAPKTELGGLKIPYTEPYWMNTSTPQIITHQLQGVEFVTCHILVLQMKRLKEKQASGRKEKCFLWGGSQFMGVKHKGQFTGKFVGAGISC